MADTAALREALNQARLCLMARDPFPTRLIRAFAADPDAAVEFYIAASEVLNDFEHWGPVIQANEDGVYDDSTEIVKLRLAYERISSLLAESRTSGGELNQ